MLVYGIIAGVVFVATIIVFLLGLLCSMRILRYGLNLGLKLNRFSETGELIVEEHDSTGQEMTE